MAIFSADGQIGRGRNGQGEFETCADLLASMDRLGVSRAIAWNIEARDGQAMKANRRLLNEIDTLGPQGNRLVPSFVISPAMLRRHREIDELAEHLASGRVKALRVYRRSITQKMSLVEPLIRQVEKYNPVIVVDVREDPDGHDMLALAGALPEIAFVCLHGRWPMYFGLYELLGVLRMLPNVVVGSTWLITEGTGRSIPERLADAFGPQRLVFTLGLPTENEGAIGRLVYAQISQEAKDCVSHGNLDRLLGLPATQPVPTPEIRVEVTRGHYLEDGPRGPEPTGPLRAEYRQKGGLQHGLCKQWHRNGVLAFEGLYNLGIPVSGCYWDMRGREMYRYELQQGSGTEITLFEDGDRWETPWVNGKKHGIQNSFSRMGRIVVQTLFVQGKNVDLDEYNAARQEDPTLPEWTLPNEGEDPNQWALDILAAGNTYEALEWLKDRARGEGTLGEGWSWKKSVSTVRRLYALGPHKVYVFDVDEETRNSGRLLIELPNDSEKRATVLAWCNRLGRKLGFDPTPDEGQRYTLVMLD